MYRRPGRRVWYAFFSDTEKHISLGTEDETEAGIAFAAMLERRRLRPESARAGEGLIVDVFDVCHERAVANHTPKTAYEIHLNLRRVAAWLEERQIVGTRHVTKQIVEDYKTARRFAQVSAARINRELDSWRKAMKVAVELKQAHPEVLDCFDRLREPRPAPHARRLNRKELTAFFKKVDPRYRDLLRSVLGSGIRDEELRHVETGDVVSGKKERWLTVTPKPGWTTKGYRFRRIPITAATATALHRFLAAKAAGLNVDKKRVWTVIQAGCTAAKVPAFSLHDLRRAWATSLVDAGNSVQLVSRWLGHRDVQTTMRYLGITDDSMPEAGKLPW